MTNLEQLILAWRKAKVDLYYSTNPPLFEMADYESNLMDNLQKLLERINGSDEAWAIEENFLGSWTLAPKAIVFPQGQDLVENTPKDTTLIFADPDDEWASITSDPAKKPVAEFRLMARCSLDFHVLSTLWMFQVGHRFDRSLSNNIYGSRLIRNAKKEINPMALGSFKPYLRPYRDWRNGAINTMRDALEANKRVIALTADISSFYHELNPEFMRDPSFLRLAGVELSESEEKLHRLFIVALQAWAASTPLKKGLPVGLPASAVIANSALIALDQFIERQVVPLYYGRYVDDILLVMENASNFTTGNEFWTWIINRDGGKDILEHSSGALLFKPSYLQNCRIVFENDKNKLFVLSGESGKTLINAVSEKIDERTSEWRSLPVLPEDLEEIGNHLIKATNFSGEQADSLSKVDALTMTRASFSLILRNYEAYERDLPPDSWQDHRHTFFDAVISHVLTPRTFFDQAQYLPRILQMATACSDFKKLGEILDAIFDLIESVSATSVHKIKSADCSPEDIELALYRWKHGLYTMVIESVVSAIPAVLSRAEKYSWQEHITFRWQRMIDFLWVTNIPLALYTSDIRDLQREQNRLFGHDLSHVPLRFCGLPKEMISQRGIPSRNKLSSCNWQALDIPFGQGVNTLSSWFKPKLVKGIPPGLYFATRPFSLNELYLLAPSPFNTVTLPELSSVVSALRGFDLAEHKMPRWDKHLRTLEIPDGEPKAKQTIAVSSWETHDSSFVAAVVRRPDPNSRRRYQRLNRLINELISRPDGSGYLILPELAIPPQWFMRIASKLNGRRISLITGVEYLHAPKKRVRNQIWASLTHDGLGFPSLMLYRQDKQTPALHEEQELYRLAGATLKPAVEWQAPPIIRHGNFYFALLNCSELTNIRYRAELRGKIDALFVPEWNKDIETYNSLVESAALDIHAYIIQCNNRQYGDSRIRAPYKERWQRDLLRVKGGNHDYCITGEIDVLALRQFQSSHRSPAKDFKPVPDGFNKDMTHARNVLPKGEQA